MARAFRAFQLLTINGHKKQWHALSTDDDKNDSMCWYCCCCCYSFSSRWIFIYIFEDDILFEILISECKPISRRWKTHDGQRMSMSLSLPTQSAPLSTVQPFRKYGTHSKPHTTPFILMHYISGRMVGHCIPFIVRISTFISCAYFPFAYLHKHTHSSVYTHWIT